MCYVIADGNKPSQNLSIVTSIIVNIANSRSSFLSFFPADLFRPGKLNMGERWRGAGGGFERVNENGEPPRPKAKLRDVEEILQTNSMTHATYHVPPGKGIL